MHRGRKSLELPVQKQFSPTIQYFIAKINNAGNLGELEAKGLEFVKADYFKSSNDADDYFIKLKSKRLLEESTRQGIASGGVSGMESQLLSFHEECAMIYVKSIMPKNASDKLAPEAQTHSPSTADNKNSLWIKDANKNDDKANTGGNVKKCSLQ